jgi:hypothetical protein
MRVAAAVERVDVAELAARVARLEADVQQLAALLQTSRGPRDAADKRLPLAIAESIGARRFTGRELLAHAAVDERLRVALENCDISAARELGHVLRRLAGETLHGVRIVRMGTDRDGIVWGCELCEL